MKRILITFLGLLILTSFDSREILINETGFDDIRIGVTTMSKIKRRHIFAKKTKTWRHALYRTDEGRIGVMYNYEQVRTKKGITYFFNYERGTQGKVKLDEILFSLPAEVTTDKGIRLGQSNMKEVEQKYGAESTIFDSDGYATKVYDGIEFYSNKLAGKDSVDESYIITRIRLKRKW